MSDAKILKPGDYELAIIGLVLAAREHRGTGSRSDKLREDRAALVALNAELLAECITARELLISSGEHLQRTGQGLKAARNFEAAAKLFVVIERARGRA